MTIFLKYLLALLTPPEVLDPYNDLLTFRLCFIQVDQKVASLHSLANQHQYGNGKVHGSNLSVHG